jgi:septal ring factor EnvC (AmiA/AmiB activator)
LLGREIYDMVRTDTEVSLQTARDAIGSRIQEIEGRIDQYRTCVQELLRERAVLQEGLSRTQAELSRTQAELNCTVYRRIRRLLGKMKVLLVTTICCRSDSTR